MNKSEFVDYMAEHCDISKADARDELKDVLDCVLDVLKDGDFVNLTGFGKFFIANVEESERRNPQTGEKMTIPAHHAPKFHFASNVKADLR